MINNKHLDNLEIITRAPNGIKLLRQLILKNAISGKLVMQDSEEGTGFELITKILDSRGIEVGAENKPTSCIPTNWGRAKLGEIFYLEMGQSPNSDSYNSRGEGLPFYQGKTDFGSFVPIPRVWCSSPTKVAEVGDVLLSVRAPVGPTNYADEKCCIGRGLAAVRPLGDMQTEFVLWWLRAYESQIAEMGTGTTFVAVSKKNLEPFMIAIPPLAEQSRILDKIKELMKQCDILESQLGLQDSLSTTARNSAVDAISTAQTPEELQVAWERIQQNWEVIADTKKDIQYLRKLIVHLGLHGWLTRDTSNYRDVSFGEVATLINGRAYKQQELLDSGMPVIRIQNLNGGKNWFYSDLDLPKDKKCVSGDLLFAWSASFGPYVWNGPEAIFHYHIWKVIPSEFVTRDYLYFLLQDKTEDVKSASHGLAMLHMTKSGMESMMIRIPSIEQQIQVVQTIEKLLQISTNLEAALILKSELAEKFSRSVVSESA